MPSLPDNKGKRMLEPIDTFPRRHIGPNTSDVQAMLKAIGVASLDELVERIVPKNIRLQRRLDLPAPKSEYELLQELQQIASTNQVFRSYIGLGYSDTVTPGVVLRNIFLNPGWYTQYTPYQAEIAQGRLEALLNFQTMVGDLTGLPVANASLLDEATAGAEAMHLMHAVCTDHERKTIWVSDGCHPQTIAVIQTRAKPLNIKVQVGNVQNVNAAELAHAFGVVVQYPATDGAVDDYRELIKKSHDAGAKVAMAADLLAMALLTPPGELGADVAFGSAQRFGVPLGFGGPHAAFFATRTEFARQVPGRIIGVSQDANGKMALRMALQTREQHIRREKATSNICTAQVLLAVMAGMYAVYHGPKGIKAIARRVHDLTRAFAGGVKQLGFKLKHENYFDTVTVEFPNAAAADEIEKWALQRRINLRKSSATSLGVSFDETVSADDLNALFEVFNRNQKVSFVAEKLVGASSAIPEPLARQTNYLTHPVFNSHHSETQMLRYIRTLESRDLSLTHSMIPLGSCTMKLNATSEMEPVTWPEFSKLHPFAPANQWKGYATVFSQLQAYLSEISGFAACSLMPNAGSQGEYAGLLVIRAFHEQRGQGARDVCLIPESAHGTNPASAVMAGYRVVVVKTDARGNVDVADLKAKADEHRERLAALMITYPSTHGVFEEGVREVCDIVHAAGGQVYMDGANMNAQVALSRPGDFGADVCHINLHKTFCIPHGGGGPGMGPICVAKHLAEFLPKHPLTEVGGSHGTGPVSAAPFGSPSILLISWVYIRLMGADGLKRATEVAMLNANYVAKQLEAQYPTLYRGAQGFVAHECILDPRGYKKSAGIEVEDIAKRLMDYGFHAPTVSFPVPGTLMVEPTESESKDELDRFIEAMVAIRAEIAAVEQGKQPKDVNLLKMSPHTAEIVTADEWTRPYSRSQAAFPSKHASQRKFWPHVSRVNNVLGDRKLICSCPPIEEYMKE